MLLIFISPLGGDRCPFLCLFVKVLFCEKMSRTRALPSPNGAFREIAAIQCAISDDILDQMWQCGAKLALSSSRGRDRLRDPDRGHLVETGRKNGIGARVDRAPFFSFKARQAAALRKNARKFFQFHIDRGRLVYYNKNIRVYVRAHFACAR